MEDLSDRDREIEDERRGGENVEHTETTAQQGRRVRITQLDEEDDDDSEYVPSDDDDEANEEEESLELDQVEREEDDGGYEELKRDAEIPIEELLARYYPSSSAGASSSSTNDDERSDSDSEYVPSDNEEEEEDEEIEDDGGEEDDGNVDNLESDQNMPLEELLAKYYSKRTDVSSEEEEEEETDSDSEYVPSDNEEEEEDEEIEDDGGEEDDGNVDNLESDQNMPLEELLAKYYSKRTDDSSEEEEEEETQSSTSHHREAAEEEEDDDENEEEEPGDNNQFEIPIPFMLTKEPPLRSYQRAGLDWLVSLHDRGLNGILADEMGLGKTIQTIALLAYLAGNRGLWGPHLIVVPTSVVMNWTMELKNWCPGLKVLTYFGSTAERAAKRTGWSKPNAFHVCVTSYQLAVTDAVVFRRKKWHYVICDEAHALKNPKSQRWRTLLALNTSRRLLLTGTPLQNSLMELWSLMHFIMPHVFSSQHEFKHWFSNPLAAVVEQGEKNAAAVRRLHQVMRPFILRRLKRDVAKQLPGKYEHVVRVPLARRQRLLYEDFISRATTKQALSEGGYLGMMSVLMRLRMVCNHPDLFEPRIVTSPFACAPLELSLPSDRFLVLGNRISSSATMATSLGDRYLSLGDASGTLSFSTRWGGGGEDDPHLRSLRRGLGVADREISPFDVNRPRSRLAALAAASLCPHPRAFLDVNAVSSVLEVEFAQTEASEREKRARLMSAFPEWVRQSLENEMSNIRTVTREKMELDRFPHRLGMGERNARRLDSATSTPIFGSELISRVRLDSSRALPSIFTSFGSEKGDTHPAHSLELRPMLERFTFVTPVASAPEARVKGAQLSPYWMRRLDYPSLLPEMDVKSADPTLATLLKSPLELDSPTHFVGIRQRLGFPDKMLLQFDCGKLQALAVMLARLKRGGHRVLIFTQMTRMLDVLESFLNLHAHTYFRLDGSTGVEDRQVMMERFNRDPRVFCFILSTRSGGLGINLTGADTVIFYDSDWNPSMDAQAQDRAHRIGQLRDVHIYRLVSERSVEENILLKSNQKRHLNRISVEEGNFGSLFGGAIESSSAAPPSSAMLKAMAEAEDEDDRDAALAAEREIREDDNDGEPPEGGENRPVETQERNKEEGENGERDAEGETPPLPDEKIEDSDGNVLMSKGEFERLRAGLSPVDLYALDFRTRHLPAYRVPPPSVSPAALEGGGNEVEPAEDWKIDEIENERERMETTGNEELVVAQGEEDVEGDAGGGEAVLAACRRAVRMERRLKMVTGRWWSKYYVEANANLPFYVNVDTKEKTWERPNVLRGQERLRRAIIGGWGALQEPVLVRVASYLLGKEVLGAFALTCKSWFLASRRNPASCVWVDPACSSQSEWEWLPVGTAVEARWKGGDVWYSATIIDVLPGGKLDLLYSDGEAERNVPREFVRRDAGMRLTFIDPSLKTTRADEDREVASSSSKAGGGTTHGTMRLESSGGAGTGLLEAVNVRLMSEFACGSPLVRPPRLADDLPLALSRIASPGDCVVLTAGRQTWVPGKSAMPSRACLVSEAAWARDMNLHEVGATRIIPGDDSPEIPTGLRYLDEERHPLLPSHRSTLEVRSSEETTTDETGGGLLWLCGLALEGESLPSLLRAFPNRDLRFTECELIIGENAPLSVGELLVEPAREGRLVILDGCLVRGEGIAAFGLDDVLRPTLSLRRCLVRTRLPLAGRSPVVELSPDCVTLSLSSPFALPPAPLHPRTRASIPPFTTPEEDEFNYLLRLKKKLSKRGGKALVVTKSSTPPPLAVLAASATLKSSKPRNAASVVAVTNGGTSSSTKRNRKTDDVTIPPITSDVKRARVERPSANSRKEDDGLLPEQPPSSTTTTASSLGSHRRKRKVEERGNGSSTEVPQVLTNNKAARTKSSIVDESQMPKRVIESGEEKNATVTENSAASPLDDDRLLFTGEASRPNSSNDGLVVSRGEDEIEQQVALA